ncbi:MAG TPA: ATPase, T2SS/T4P/T4SS family, partial [Polyangiaceae bacterium]|nr:ATPase, T2SS/T4P/T4SS family [Polyangiaceae bacterium]
MIPREVFAETLLGFLEPIREFLEDPSVSEVMLNGPRDVYVERHGRLTRTNADFQSPEAVMRALRNVAQFVGKHLDEYEPILEARLPDGSRVHAIIPPAAPDGPYVSIRRFSKQTFTLARMLERGMLTEAAAEALESFVKAKLNIMIAGGTGSGKTSLLNMLTVFVPTGERIAVIEDSREIQAQKPHVVYLEARPPDAHGRGAVTI